MRNRLAARSFRTGGADSPRAGFTLIELLIVVGIISILASIATPNFLEAQTRAKTARVKNDARVVAVALEDYAVDNSDYPYREPVTISIFTDPYYFGRCDTKLRDMKVMTTPIAYISTLPIDVFNKKEPEPGNVLDYWSPEIQARFVDKGGSIFSDIHATNLNPGFVVVSVGPDGVLGYAGNYNGCPSVPMLSFAGNTIFKTYDPTNGTVSYGNVFRLQSGGEGSTFYNHL